MSLLIIKPPAGERVAPQLLKRLVTEINDLAKKKKRIVLSLNEGWEVIHCDAPLVRATAKEDGHQIALEFADEIDSRDPAGSRKGA